MSVKNTKPFVIIGLGEVLFDVLPEGEKIGGAPMNFAYHAGALGARGVPVSTVGRDERGERALRELAGRGLPVAAISEDPDRPTGYVAAAVDGQGLARYVFPEDVAWDHLALNDAALAAAAEADAVCFGSLAQRSPDSRRAVARFLKATPEKTFKVFDVNLRQNFYSREILEASLRMADMVKLSDEELPVLADMFSLGSDEKTALMKLLRRHCLHLAVLTRGPRGSVIASLGEISEHPGERAEVADTIGAGDSFTAATVLGILNARPLDEINAHANKVAAYVCSQAGAMPPIPEALKLP